ncbi:MAG: thioredoxin family protein [Fidelibacterota bacterium]|nr:MAG: thioredoxin family protein [Candidatus Neomarinimicrobiota bacterium]
MRKKSTAFYLFLALVLANSCETNAQEKIVREKQETGKSTTKITFIELGSVRCIPCRAMQPVMRAIEERYGDQIDIIFYDVWTPDQRRYAQEYKIRLIPTQVFQDSTGTEILRHEGFFPEKEITVFLDSKGLKPITDD